MEQKSNLQPAIACLTQAIIISQNVNAIHDSVVSSARYQHLIDQQYYHLGVTRSKF